MNNRSMKKLLAAGAVTIVTLAGMTACTAPGNGGNGGDGGKVELTWWHNGTQDPLKGFWQEVADEFEEANPNVTVKVEGVQNEELQRTKIPNALRGNNPPDLFQQWGGGELTAQVEAGRVLDISDDVAEELELIGGSAAGWQVGGKTYGLPFSLGIEGFWYNKALFAEAGIEGTPTTLDELYDAVDKLKAADVAPIALGAGDKWPAGHYWYNFALKSCSLDTLKTAADELKFDDECFVDAGEQLQELVDAEPFQEGFLGTPAQKGATSSAGLLANGKAGMELMGHWNPGVMTGLTEDGKGLGEDLGWFPFPSIEGSAGDPTAALGGGDGFSCSYQAPPECVDLLKYISSVDVQTRFAETGAGLPVTAGAEAGVSDPNMKALLDARNNASYVQLWLDTSYGPTVGGAMNDNIANFFAGQASAEDIVKAMNDAAATL